MNAHTKLCRETRRKRGCSHHPTATGTQPRLQPRTLLTKNHTMARTCPPAVRSPTQIGVHGPEGCKPTNHAVAPPHASHSPPPQPPPHGGAAPRGQPRCHTFLSEHPPDPLVLGGAGRGRGACMSLTWRPCRAAGHPGKVGLPPLPHIGTCPARAYAMRIEHTRRSTKGYAPGGDVN